MGPVSDWITIIIEESWNDPFSESLIDYNDKQKQYKILMSKWRIKVLFKIISSDKWVAIKLKQQSVLLPPLKNFLTTFYLLGLLGVFQLPRRVELSLLLASFYDLLQGCSNNASRAKIIPAEAMYGPRSSYWTKLFST